MQVQYILYNIYQHNIVEYFKSKLLVATNLPLIAMKSDLYQELVHTSVFVSGK